ncbi:hypothetical protein ACLB2K_023014 [Fragaria x ananassa]
MVLLSWVWKLRCWRRKAEVNGEAMGARSSGATSWQYGRVLRSGKRPRPKLRPRHKPFDHEEKAQYQANHQAQAHEAFCVRPCALPTQTETSTTRETPHHRHTHRSVKIGPARCYHAKGEPSCQTTNSSTPSEILSYRAPSPKQQAHKSEMNKHKIHLILSSEQQTQAILHHLCSPVIREGQIYVDLSNLILRTTSRILDLVSAV